MKKVCNICKIEKDIEQFRLKKKNEKYYIYSYCKECEKKEKQKEKNKLKQREYSRKHYEQHKIQYNERSKKYYLENIEKCRKINREKFGSEYRKQWRLNNPEKVKQYIHKDTEKRKMEPLRCLKDQTRDVIRNAFRRKGYKKDSKTKDIIGCDYETFITHLLKTFKNNYGYDFNFEEKVHIDHIVPLVTAKTEQEIIKLCNYKNLQLLKAKDNLKKGAKLNFSL